MTKINFKKRGKADKNCFTIIFKNVFYFLKNLNFYFKINFFF